MSIVMLYNHGGCENRGCEAIVRSTSELFVSLAGARCILATDQLQYDRSISLPAVDRVFQSNISPYSPVRFVNSVGFRLGFSHEGEVARKYSPVIAQGKRSDVCLSVGGDTYCYNPQEHLRVINERLHRVGKPLVLWCCSAEPERVADEKDFQNYSLIIARESISAKAFADANLPVRQWCDPAFMLGREELPLPQGWKDGATVGLNVSPLALECAKNEQHVIDAFTALILHIMRTSEDAVALTPHVTWGRDDDRRVLARLKARFADNPRVLMLSDALNAIQLKGYIGRMCALVTARTHASIAAYSSCVPTLVIGYSVKAKGIARDLFGDERGHLLPIQEIESEHELLAAYDAMRAREQQERAFLRERLPAYTAGGKEIVCEVMSLAGK